MISHNLLLLLQASSDFNQTWSESSVGKGLQKLSTVWPQRSNRGHRGQKCQKNLAFTENATPPTCYTAGSRDSGILTSLRPFTKLIDSNLDFGSFGVTGVKSSSLLKMLLFILYTLYGHVTYAYKQAWDPLQNSLTQILIWGHLGSHGSKGYFH